MAAPDDFSSVSNSMLGPIENGADVTPNDGADLSKCTRSVYVGGTGDLSVVLKGGQTVVFTAVPAGSLLPIRCDRIRATGTTATAILALW